MSNQSHIPNWITPDIFENALKASVPDYKNIENFKVYDAMGPGENYVGLALKVEIEVRLTDLSLTTQSFFLKVGKDNELSNNILQKLNVFTKEHETYRVFIPEFEQMYRNAGIEIEFGPKAYDLPVKYEYLLLEDLCKKDFKNVNRQNGLDMYHCQGVLKKLAQWHAASAVRVQRKGCYDKIYLHGAINPDLASMVHSMMGVAIQNILSVAKDLKDNHVYYEQLNKLKNTFPQFLLDNVDHNPNEFNVLNHGDFWCNNIMFQYDDDEQKIKEILLIDYQLMRYGSPGHDLVYFLLTSPQLQLKIQRYDELIKCYYDHLIENLKLLKYSKPLPTLGDIHKSITEARAFSTFAAFSITPAVLADPVETATLEHLVGDSAESIKFKEQTLRQKRICKHLEVMLPWMYFKGHFEYK